MNIDKLNIGDKVIKNPETWIVIAGEAGDYWKDKVEYYPAILKLLKEYNLETIRFACDW